MARRKSAEAVTRKFSQVSLDRALTTLDHLVQNDTSPKKANGRINRNKLVIAMKDVGVPRELTLALIKQLVAQKVFRRGKQFVDLYIFTPFVGEQVDRSEPNEYLHVKPSRWNTLMNDRERAADRMISPVAVPKAESDDVAQTESRTPQYASSSRKLLLFGYSDAPLVGGKSIARLTKAGFDVLKALCVAGESGLALDDLIGNSRHADARGILKRLMKKNARWKTVIRLAKKSGNRYRVV